jgi:hypothetical protein
MSYMLCKAPNSREFYMTGERMFSCFGYAPSVDENSPDTITGWTAVGFKEYPTWREMADDMEVCGIKNIFAPFARDWG